MCAKAFAFPDIVFIIIIVIITIWFFEPQLVVLIRYSSLCSQELLLVGQGIISDVED